MTNNKPNDARVPRELLQQWLDDIGESRHVTQYAATKREQLRAILAQPADQQGEPVALHHMAVAEDGELRWMSGRKMQNCELYARPDGGRIPSVLYRHAQPATAKVVPPEFSDLREQYESWADANGYDITRNEHGDYAGIVEDSMWSGWQAKAEHWKIPDRIVIGQSIELDTKAIGWNECLDEVAKLNGGAQ